MNELKLSIQEAQELLLLSQSSEYSWIDKGKLQYQETPGGKIIVISRKEAEEIRNFNIKSRRNKVARQVIQNSAQEEFQGENSVTNVEILESEPLESVGKSSFENSENKVAEQVLAPTDMTLKLITRIEELALEAGRFKQLEILRNEEKENVKFWMEKYHELSAELKKKDYEINALKLQIQELKGKNPLLNFFKKN